MCRGVVWDVAPAGSVMSGSIMDFEHFYRQEYAPVLQVTFALTGDRQRAADVTHDAFAVALSRWATVASYDRPDLWVRRVAINRAISMRRRRLNEAVSGRRWQARQRLAADDDPGSDADVWSLVRRLPARQASVVVLTYIGDMSAAQVAAVLGFSEAMAKTHLLRAKRTLASWLGDDDED